MPLGVLPNLRPFTTVQTAPGPLTLPSRPWSVLVVDQAVAAAFTVLLPASPPKNTIVQVKDGKGDASANAITIDGNGQQIDGAATTSISTDYGAVYLGYDGAEWRVLANVGAGGGGGGGQGASTLTINQSFAPGSALYFDGAAWQLADASGANSLGLAIVLSSTAFPAQSTIAFSGYVTGLPDPYPIEQGGVFAPAPLTPGQYYFVSDADPGSLTLTEPASYSNPLLFAISTTEAVVLPFRPSVTSGGGISAGPYPALLPQTSHWYKCNDANGNLVNSAPGGADPLLPILASPYAAIYQDVSLYTRGTPSLRMTAQWGIADRFEASLGSLISNVDGLILEATVAPDTGSQQFFVELANAARTSGAFLWIDGSSQIAMGEYGGGSSAVPALAGFCRAKVIRVAAVRVAATASVELWVNGGLVYAGSAWQGFAQYDRIAVGNTVGASGAQPNKGGAIADVRITPSDLGSLAARASYFRAAFEAACAQ